jgi:hypothetical protein
MDHLSASEKLTRPPFSSQTAALMETILKLIIDLEDE